MPSGPLDRLDLDDVGAERRERVRRRGTGPERREVHHPHTGERRCGGPTARLESLGSQTGDAVGLPYRGAVRTGA